MKKLVFLLVIMKLLFGIAKAETTIIKVPEEKTLVEAVAEINAAISGEFVISLTEDITTNQGISFNSKTVKTILGNNHTIHYNGVSGFIGVNNGTLKLGSEQGNNILILEGEGAVPSGFQNDPFIQVQAISGSGYQEGSKTPALEMYDGVTIRDYAVDNSLGGAIKVYSSQYSSDHVAVFNMYGGTITNCGVVSGYNQYGGGVGVGYNGVFNMSGGKITNCHAYVGGGVYLDDYSIGIAPQFNMTGGEISDNTAIFAGGGVCVPRGKFTMSDGSITGNNAVYGGGIYEYRNGQGISFTGGFITDNTASHTGGGVYTTKPFTMSGGILCNNTADVRASDIYGTGAVTLSSASAMKQLYKKDGAPTRFVIDGWYIDYPSSSLTRWKYDQAFAGESTENIYFGDTVNDSGMPLIAAFTAYDAIEVTKTWDDADNVLGKRPESLTFRLTDPSGNPVRLRAYDESSRTWTADGAEAIVTLGPADEDPPGSNTWTGTIEPLSVGDYSDTTQYLLKEDDTGIFYVPNTVDPTITFTPDEAGGIATANPGVFSAAFTNVGRQPVTIVKVWNDANNKDGIRPAVLNTQLVIGSTPQADMDGRDVFPLEEDQITHTWTTTVYLPAKDYSALQATEGEATGYEQSNYHRSIAADGTLSFVFENKHTPAPAEMNTVANGSMVNINYEARKTWPDTPPTVAKPNVKIKLTGDNGYSDVQSLVNDTATFANIPKYLDNEGNNPVTYTLSEILDDPLWIEVNGEFYSLDGMGKYIPRITNVTAAEIGSTGADGTVTTGTIENNYVYNQPTTSATVIKRWNDHQNENGARPQYLKLGLFKVETDSIPVSTVTITGPMDNDAWNGTFTGLPLYDDSGARIDYSSYIVKEAYPTTLNPDGTPAGWDNWVSYGESYTITRDGHTYKYDYSVGTEP